MKGYLKRTRVDKKTKAIILFDNGDSLLTTDPFLEIADQTRVEVTIGEEIKICSTESG